MKSETDLFLFFFPLIFISPIFLLFLVPFLGENKCEKVEVSIVAREWQTVETTGSIRTQKQHGHYVYFLDDNTRLDSEQHYEVGENLVRQHCSFVLNKGEE